MITISSQKEDSVGVYSLVFAEKKIIYGYISGTEFYRLIGIYDTPERAIDVLEEIKGIVHSRSDKFYQMPIR